MDAKLYPGNFSRKNVIGDRQVILTTTPEKMRTIQQQVLRPQQLGADRCRGREPGNSFRARRARAGKWKRGADPFAADPIPAFLPFRRVKACSSKRGLAR